MSQEHVEIVRRAWEASNRGTPKHCSRSTTQPRQFFREWTDPLETFRAQAETFIDAGDRVVVGTRVWARGKGSGVEGEMLQGIVYTLRNGLVIRVDLYETKQIALKAVGLSE